MKVRVNPCLIVICVGLGGAAGCKSPDVPPSLPPAIAVPAGHVEALRVRGKGVQIYICDPQKLVWTLKAPEADLLSERGGRIGTHSAGPTWEKDDGSKVVGRAVATHPSPDAGSIPWLLIKAKANEGAGVFGKVTYIQRLETKGGNAPAGGCDAGTAGQEARVGYTAEYRFYVAAR